MTATQKRWTLIAVILGSGIVFLDTSVVNLALPRIAAELPSRGLAPLEAQAYVANGYFITLSALLILGGALNDFHGRKKMFGYGLGGFLLTSLLCGLAPNMEMLIVFRILQGAAGALVVPGSLAIITASFEGEEQGRAFGIWAGASAATTIIGPAVGGALVNTISWRAAFLLNVPLLLVAIWATFTHVPESRDEEATGHFDWVGSLVVIVAVAGLAFGTIRGQQRDWQDVGAFVSLGIGAAATIVFPVLMRRTDKPWGQTWVRTTFGALSIALLITGVLLGFILDEWTNRLVLVPLIAAPILAILNRVLEGRETHLVPLKLFGSRNFSVTNLSTFVIYGALYVTITFQGIFLIGTLGYSEPAAGIAGIPATLLLALFSTRFGRLAARHGPRRYMVWGPAVMALGLLLLARVPATSEPWVLGTKAGQSLFPPTSYFLDFLPALLIFGAGLMIMVAPLTTALMTSIPKHRSGVASAINNAISRVGSPLITAVIFVAVVSSFYGSIQDRVPGADTSSPSFRQEVAPLNVQTAPEDVKDPAREASTDAFHLAMLVAAGLMLAGAAINLRIDNRQALDHPGQTGEEGGAAVTAAPSENIGPHDH